MGRLIRGAGEKEVMAARVGTKTYADRGVGEGLLRQKHFNRETHEYSEGLNCGEIEGWGGGWKWG